MPDSTIHIGDSRSVLANMPGRSVHCCVTSPPYWGLRDYGHDDQIGLEGRMEDYITELVEIFAEVKRVLRDDGTVWLNLGDSYAREPKKGDKFRGANGRPEPGQNPDHLSSPSIGAGLKPKDQNLLPHRVAMALQEDGWWLRSTIVWAKGVSFCDSYAGSCMPEPVRDRPTSGHEYIFLLSKSERYFYDDVAVREQDMGEPSGNGSRRYEQNRDGESGRGHSIPWNPGDGRNLRDVWTIPTKGFTDAHFAVFPPDLVEPCIKAGTSKRGVCPECGAPWERETERKETGWDGSKYGKRVVEATGGAISGGTDQSTLGSSGGTETAEYETVGWSPTCDCGPDQEPVPATVLDPFAGAGTTGLTALKLGRSAELIELVPEYAEMAADRIREEVGTLFASVDINREPKPA